MYIIYIVYIYTRHMIISPTGSCFCSFGFSC